MANDTDTSEPRQATPARSPYRVTGDELGAARVARLREALEAIEQVAQRGDLSGFPVEGGEIVCPARFIERIGDLARDALSDDALTRDRPTQMDIRVSTTAAVVLDHALAHGEIR